MKVRTMSNNNELKNKITNWLLEAGATFSQAVDEKAEFRLPVTWGYVIDVVKVKESPQITSVATMTFTDEKITKAFSKLTKKERIQFFYDLQSGLVTFPISYTITPNTLEKLESITYYHTIYVEDLTKTSLIDTLDRIRRAMYFTSLLSNNRLEMEVNTPNVSDGKLPGMG